MPWNRTNLHADSETGVTLSANVLTGFHDEELDANNYHVTCGGGIVIATNQRDIAVAVFANTLVWQYASALADS